MSLILTQSNSAPGSNPASYVNRFKNTFEIKANAEIAVQEVVLNRQGKFEVSRRARLYFRHGTDDWHTPLLVPLTPGTYSPEQLAEHVETQLNLYDSHPQYQGGWKCNVVRNGDLFERFNIHVDQKAAVTASAPPASDRVTVTDAMTYNPSTGGMVVSDANAGRMTINDPISANTGELVVEVASIDDVPGKLYVMLDSGFIDNIKSPKSLRNTMFLIYLDGRNDALNVAQHDPTHVAVGTLHTYEGFFGNGNTRIKLKLEGEQLSVFAGTSANDELVPVYSAFTHINSAIYALTPRIMLDKSSNITLIKYAGMSSFNQDAVNSQNIFNGPQLHLASERAYLTGVSTYTTLSDGFLDTQSHLVFGPYDTVLDASMGDEMGFTVPNMPPSTTQKVASTKHREIWHGSTDLSISGDGLLYVRLTGLTFESQNGAVQGPSRIIQPLARFTDNKTFGRMHFVPPERTYLKLHNPHKLMVQEIQIDIVNADETIATDLQAITYVTLHVR